MGYTTRFEGLLLFDRDLTVREYKELLKIADYNEQDDGVLLDYTDAPETMPHGSYLQWQPNNYGTGLEWNGGEKFYDYVHWLRWLIKHYFTPRNITLNGELRWQGEDISDVGILTVDNNKVTTQKLEIKLTECPSCGHRFKSDED